MQRQCKPWMQSPLSIRSLASSTTTTGKEAVKVGMVKRMTASLGHAAAPIGVLAAICSVALMVGAHTATLQFLRSPSVQVMKKNRDCVPEVEKPDAAIRSGDKLINTSFLRKVGHLQEKQYGDNNGVDIYTRYVLIIIFFFTTIN